MKNKIMNMTWLMMVTRKSLFPLVTLALSTVAIIGCTPPGVLIGAGATVGAMSLEETGLEQAGRDVLTEARLTKELANMKLGNFSNISIEVQEGRALIVGHIQTEQARLLAIEAIWKDHNIIEVYNYLQIAPALSILQKTYDTTIHGKIRARLVGEKEVKSVNYGFEVMDGIVYVIGIAQNAQEVEMVMKHIRDVPRVRQIISHVILKDGDARRAYLQKLKASLLKNE